MNQSDSRPLGSGAASSVTTSSVPNTSVTNSPGSSSTGSSSGSNAGNSSSGSGPQTVGTNPPASSAPASGPPASGAPGSGGPAPRPQSSGFNASRDRRGPPVRNDSSRRINHQIRIRQIRVIDEDGKQLGVLETADALALALHKGLDLVEIAPEQRPPVCRIMDFGKFKYEEKKKQQASKRKQHQVQIKEVRVRPKICEHDVQVKVRQARTFIADGDKVMVNCLFRGREMAHKEVADGVMRHVYDLLQDIAKVEVPPHMEGKRMVMLLTKR